MGVGYVAERSDASVPVQLAVSRNGPVTGLTCVVAIRDPDHTPVTPPSYLDFADLTFKTAGWTTRQAALTDIGGGRYSLSGGLDVSSITNLSAGTHHLVAEFDVTGSVRGITDDVIEVVVSAYDASGDVWDQARAAHVAAGSFGEGVNLFSALPGSISAPSFAAGAIDAVALAADAVAEIADGILTRAIASVEPAAGRTLYGAICKLVNKVDVVGTLLRVTATDDTTVVFSQQTSVDPAASPITSVDTV